MTSLNKYTNSWFSDELKLIHFLSQNSSVKNLATSSKINWILFIDLIKKHRLVSHVLKHSESKDILPASIYKELKTIQLSQIKKSLLLNSELLRIHDALNKKNIDHLFFKGSLLSFELYNDTGFRNFRDIDLLVHKSNIEQAKSAIIELEYKLFDPDFELTKKQKRINYSLSHHYHLQHKELPVDIELHWNLTNPKSFLSITTEKLLKNKQFVDFQTYNLPYISKLENIVFLAAHGSIHQWYRLFWLKDFSILLSSLNINEIQEAWELSKELSLQKCFIQACFLSENIYNNTLPDCIREQKFKSSLLKVPLKSIATTELKQSGLIGKLKYPLYRLRLKSDLKYCFDLIFRLRTHFSDWKRVKLPDFLFFLYYPLRPFLLVYKLITKK
jgi:hypothetical protein